MLTSDISLLLFERLTAEVLNTKALLVPILKGVLNPNFRSFIFEMNKK